MAKVEYQRTDAPTQYRVAKGTDGALHVKNVGSGSAVATNGTVFSMEGTQVLAYNADGTLNYIEVTASAVTYRKTFTYTSGNLTGISGWVAQ